MEAPLTAENKDYIIVTNQTTSEQSKAVVDAYYQAGVRGRLIDFAPYLHPDFSTTAPNYLPCGGVRAGAAFFRDEVLPNLLRDKKTIAPGELRV